MAYADVTLLKVYLQVGQALNALLPGSDPAMTATELAAAERALETAAAGIPAECLKIGATVDGPGDVGLVSPVMTRQLRLAYASVTRVFSF